MSLQLGWRCFTSFTLRGSFGSEYSTRIRFTIVAACDCSLLSYDFFENGTLLPSRLSPEDDD